MLRSICQNILSRATLSAVLLDLQAGVNVPHQGLLRAWGIERRLHRLPFIPRNAAPSHPVPLHLPLLQHKSRRGRRLAGQCHHGYRLAAATELERAGGLQFVAGGGEFDVLFVRSGQQGESGVALADVHRLAVVAQVELDAIGLGHQFEVDVFHFHHHATVHGVVCVGVVVIAAGEGGQAAEQGSGGDQGDEFHGVSWVMKG